MKMLFRMTKMSFVLTMVLCLILASFTNLNASTPQTFIETENLNLNSEEDKLLPIEAYFIKNSIKSDQDPDGMYISTIINKEGESLNNLNVTLFLVSQLIDELEITCINDSNNLAINQKIPEYSLDFNEGFKWYTLTFSEEVTQPLKLTIKTKLLLESIIEAASSSDYEITNIIEVNADGHNYPLTVNFNRLLKGLTYLNLEIANENTSNFKFNLNYRSMNKDKKQTITIDYDINLLLTEASIQDLKSRVEIDVDTDTKGRIKIVTSVNNLKLTFDLKIDKTKLINTNTSLYTSASLDGSSLKSIVNFNYNPISVEDSKSIFYKDKGMLETSFGLKSNNHLEDLKIQIENNSLDLTASLEKVVVEDLYTNKLFVEDVDFVYDEISKTIQFKNNTDNLNIKVKHLMINKDNIKSFPPSLDFYIFAKVDTEVNVVKYLNIEIDNSQNKLDVKNSVLGSYEAISKVITWEIIANFRDNSSDENILTSTLSEKEKYVEDSLKVIQYKQLSDGSLTLIKDLNSSEYKVLYDKESNILSININNTQPAVYKFILKTSLANQEIQYHCHHLSSININNEPRKIKTTITIPYVNLHINKLGKQNKSIVDWTILVNEKQSTLDNVEILSYLCDNQTFIKDSLKVYKTTVKSDGSYVIDKNPLDENNYVIKYLEQGFSLTLMNTPITSPYVITYKSLPKLNQSIRLLGTVILNNLEKAVEVVDYLAPPAVTDPTVPSLPENNKAKYSIYKVNEDKLALANVVFELKSKSDQTTYTATTNKDGLAIFEDLDYGSYILKEVATIPGYIIDQKLIDGVDINIDRKVCTDTFTNRAQTLSIKSVSENLDSLSGGVFDLSLKVDNEYIKVGDNFTIDKEIQFKRLLPGKYKLSQINPMPAYIHNLEEVNFEILLNQDTSVEFINYKGRVLVYDQYKEVFVKGASFKIIDLNNNIIDSFTLKQNPYQINDLAPKLYQLESVSPALGYVHVNKSVNFNIENKSYGKPKPVIVYVESEKVSKLEKASQPVNTGIANNKVLYINLMLASLMFVSQFKRKK